MDPSRLLAVSVTPVVLISACGLVTLALYNRLGMILARIRTFQQQKIDLLKEAAIREIAEQQQMMVMVDSQIDKITLKAKVIQKGLYCLMSAVLAFLLCSLLTAAAVLHETFGILALVMDVAGLLLFMAGIGWAVRELTLSLTPLEEESAYLDVLTTQYKTRLESGRRLHLPKRADFHGQPDPPIS